MTLFLSFEYAGFFALVFSIREGKELTGGASEASPTAPCGHSEVTRATFSVV